ISRATTRLVLCDLNLEKLDSVIWKMSERVTPELLISEAAECAMDMAAKHGISSEQLLGMGIGAVGPLDRNSGTILNPLRFPAPGWNNVPICEQLEQSLGLPVLLDNGANTALLA